MSAKVKLSVDEARRLCPAVLTEEEYRGGMRQELMQTLSSGAMRRIVAKMIDKAEEGDVQAAKLLLAYAVGPATMPLPVVAEDRHPAALPPATNGTAHATKQHPSVLENGDGEGNPRENLRATLARILSAGGKTVYELGPILATTDVTGLRAALTGPEFVQEGERYLLTPVGRARFLEA